MTEINGYHLPSFEAERHREWLDLEFDDLRVRVPILSANDLTIVCETISRNRKSFLAQTSVSEIVQHIDAAAALLQTDLPRVVMLISRVTGYSTEVVQETMEHMLRDWRAPALNEMLRAELGDIRALDEPVRDPNTDGKTIAAFGFPLALHVFAGNVPGVAVTSLIRSLLVKSATIGKTASGEPLLPVLFAEALHKVSSQLASCLAITYWESGNEDLERIALQAADACVVYGGGEAVESIARKFAPDKRLVVHGPRYSFGIVNDISATTAASVARAVAAFDQQGCVSPHVVYVTGEKSRAGKFAADVAREMETIAGTLPRGRLTPEEAVAINELRTEAEFSSGDVELFGNEDAPYSVIFEADPGFRVSCLNRVLFIKPIATARDVATRLPGSRLVQSVALEGFGDKEKAELVRTLGQSGVSRITTFDRLPWPPMHWHHDGSSPLRELIWWLDIEA